MKTIIAFLIVLIATTPAMAQYSAVTPLVITPSSNLTLAAANTSQTLVVGGICPNFLYVANAVEAANEGIATAEPVFVNRTPSAAAAGGGGPSVEITPGVIQPFVASTVTVTWVAATIGHKITAWCE